MSIHQKQLNAKQRLLYISLFSIILLLPNLAKATSLRDNVQGSWFQLSKNEEEIPDNILILYAFENEDDSYLAIQVSPSMVTDEVEVSFDILIYVDMSWEVQDDQVLMRVDTEKVYVDVNDLIVNGEEVEMDQEEKDALIDDLNEVLEPWIESLTEDSEDLMTDIVFDGDYMYFKDKKGNRYKNERVAITE